ncbi:Putative membrane protein YeiH [Microbacterium esteraromaticum]|uniref:Putative membrane protein YeiH n=1 Tax=Microbacterium esteraromaticum TaxID=57043 RepID=A0A1R4ICP3_9MICO|nr:putative sulfate exporter family transporter [Microbacterium esteraromaticum]SJN17043.1 Putative membrane protein YeiH [Microbacterium esteraromaticum]
MQLLPLQTLSPRLARRGIDVLPGVVLTATIAVASTGIGTLVPVLGSAVPAIIIGVVLSLLRGRMLRHREPDAADAPAGRWVRFDASLQPGITYSSKFLLQLAVVVLGAQLSLMSILQVGLESLPVMLSTLAVCLVAAWWLGKVMRIEGKLTTLIGVGTGICGASAIAAAAPVIGAVGAQITYAVSTIFLFNILAVVLFPLLGHALNLDPHTFGLLAGTAVNDTSSVVAAASVYSTAALGFAVVVKLVRTLMIIPISIGLSVIEARKDAAGQPLTGRRIAKLVPWFLIGFVIVAIVNSTGVIPEGPRNFLVHASVFLIAMALAGIGLSTDIPALRRAGLRPLALGAILWILVTATALATIAITAGLRG